MNERLQVLLLEDSPTDALLIQEALAEADDLDCDLLHAETLAEGLTAAQQHSFGAALVDLGLPDSQGIDTCRALRRVAPTVPLLVFTALDDRKTSQLALHEGAQDYLLKRDLQPAILGRAIRYAIERNDLHVRLKDSRDRLRLLAIRIETVREQERIRISREFHDELGQKLSGLKMDLQWILKHLETPRESASAADVRTHLEESVRLADVAIATVQRVAFELRPSALDHLGLAGAMREEARRFEARTGVAVAVDLSPDLRTPNSDVSTAFFRIFQELLTNVARHAAAQKVDVAFHEIDGTLALEVRDDGVGMPAHALGLPTSLGLLGMHERAAHHGGDIVLDSTPGNGTAVVVRIPVPAS